MAPPVCITGTDFIIFQIVAVLGSMLIGLVLGWITMYRNMEKRGLVVKD